MSDDYDTEHGYSDEDYAEMLKEWVVYCYSCKAKIGVVVGGKFPPKSRRICSKCKHSQDYLENPTSPQERKRRQKARKMSHEEVAARRGEYKRQAAYVRCPRWVLERLMEAVPPEVNKELAVEVRAALQDPDPLPGDPYINPRDPWRPR